MHVLSTVCMCTICNALAGQKKTFMFLNFFLDLFCFIYMSVLLACVCPRKPEEGIIRFLGTGITNGHEPVCGYWELTLNPSPSRATSAPNH